MYCRACGAEVQAAAAFCPSCGVETRAVNSHADPMASGWIVLALALFFPVGLYLMWTRSLWDDDVKWGISGFFFPALWGRFIWKTRWSPGAQMAASAVLLVFIELVNAALFHFESGPLLGIFLLNVLVLVLVARTVRPAPEDTESLRSTVESTLEACDDLIAEIEADMSLDLLPIDASPRQHYVLALEMRGEGLRMFERAATEADLIAVDRKVRGAADALRAVRESVREIPLSGS